MGRTSKAKAMQAALESAKPVNDKIKITNVAMPDTPKKKFHCTCCGKGWDVQKGNFATTKSPLYYANNGFITICNECRDVYYYQLVPYFNGDEDMALDRMCGLFDWYINDDIAAMCRNSTEDRTRLSHFLSRKNTGQGQKGTTYLDTIKERLAKKNFTVDTEEDVEKVTEYKVTPGMIKFWGAGYEPQTLQTLQGYYDDLSKLCDGKPDIKKQKMMKNLCLIEYQIQLNIQNGKDIGTLSNSYKSMFEAAGLKAEEADVSNDVFGKWIAEIERYSPAEYYKDKNKYHDFFGIVEYIERFMFRPLKNLIFGTKDPEKEYWITDADTDGKGGG